MACLTLVPAPAHATIRPPADSLQVRLDWIDRTGLPWLARVRAQRYTTTGRAPGSTVFTALALRLPDSLAIYAADSVLVVLPGTRIPAAGYPVLWPHGPTATSFRGAAGAPAGGFWLGARATARTAVVLPNEPVDILWFVRVAPDTSGTTAAALRRSTFGSATADGGGIPTGNVAFKSVSKLALAGARGGSGGPQSTEP